MSKDLRPNYFTPVQALEHCNISKPTFYKYVKLLGLIPCKAYKQKGVYYEAEGIAKVLKLHVMPIDLYDKRVNQRAQNLKEAYKAGRLP